MSSHCEVIYLHRKKINREDSSSLARGSGGEYEPPSNESASLQEQVRADQLEASQIDAPRIAM